MSRRVFLILLLAILAVAAGLRLPQLDVRPMHTDEAVHAVKLEELWRTGHYEYNPEEYHGPTIYYAALPVLWLCGDKSVTDFTEWQLRIVPVIFGLGLIALLPLIADGLGRRAALIAGLLTAVSTAFTFYSRYYIQEMSLVFFTFLTIAAGWRYFQSRKMAWAILAGVGIGLMHATKETCVIPLGCMAVALLLVWSSRPRPLPSNAETAAEGDRSTFSAEPRFRAGRRLRRSDVAAAVAALVAAILVSVTFYSALFTELGGPLKSILTYKTYFDRAGNHGLHNHPWHFYFERLLYFHRAPGPTWSEWPILAFALLGAIVAFRSLLHSHRRDAESAGRGENHQLASLGGPLRPLRLCDKTAGGEVERLDAPERALFLLFLASFTMLLTASYSAISYKTAWCMLGFLHGMILLAGVGIAAAMSFRGGAKTDGQSPSAGPLESATDQPRATGLQLTGNILLLALAIIGVAHLARQTWLSNTKFYADNRNPYVYAHPVNGVKDLGHWVDRLAAASLEGRQLRIHVFTPDAWPLPWYLRGYEQAGYWETLPADCEASVVVAWPEFTAELEQRFGDRYQVSHYGLRPGLVLTVYARRDLYDAFVAQQRK